MRRPAGPVRAAVIRAVFYGLSLVINIVISVLLARRLVAKDYAAYQFVTKRVIQYASIPLSFFGLWSYRYVATRRRGSLGALLVLLAISVAISIPLGIVLGLDESNVGLEAAALAGLVVASQNVYFTITSALDAMRPVRRALLSPLYRLLYLVGILIALYLMAPTLTHAFIGTLAALLMGAVLGAYWLAEEVRPEYLRGGKETLLEWAKGSQPLIISFVIGTLTSFDAVVAYDLGGYEVVAAFFVVAAAATLVREAANNGLSYLHQYVLRTGDVNGAARAVYLVTTATVPFFIYAAVHPIYVIYVFNPVYYWAATATRVFMVIAIVEVMNVGISNVLAGSIREVGLESVGAFTRINVWGSVPSAVYFGALAALMVALREYGPQDLILAWSIAYGLRFITSTLINYWLLPKEAKSAIRPYVSKVALSSLLAAALAFAISPWSPPVKGLVGSVKVLALPGLAFLASYFALLLVDRDIRSMARSLLSGIIFGGRGQGSVSPSA
ncbi:MAG: hypothetical protein JCHSAcid_14400 [uncultured Acidilobus sp. JCHS]|nr:MAG: hypothetical protein JCHSAcid_14400 [uncultured Acidilobus sp. JCHS]